MKNFLKISIGAGSKSKVSVVCSWVVSPYQTRGESCFLGRWGKGNKWDFISTLQMSGTVWNSGGGRTYGPRLQQSSQTYENHPACSEPHAWRSQRLAGKWEEVETCYPRAQSNVLTTRKKKIKINTLRNSVTDMQRRSKQGLKYLGWFRVGGGGKWSEGANLLGVLDRPLQPVTLGEPWAPRWKYDIYNVKKLNPQKRREWSFQRSWDKGIGKWWSKRMQNFS